MIDHFQPQPGQTADACLAMLRDSFEQHVQDFTQDQKIAALIEEERRDNTDDADDITTPVTGDAKTPATGDTPPTMSWADQEVIIPDTGPGGARQRNRHLSAVGGARPHSFALTRTDRHCSAQHHRS